MTALILGHVIDGLQLVQLLILSAGIFVVDQIVSGGGVEALVVDSVGRVINGSYAKRVAYHESGCAADNKNMNLATIISSIQWFCQVKSSLLLKSTRCYDECQPLS